MTKLSSPNSIKYQTHMIQNLLTIITISGHTYDAFNTIITRQMQWGQGKRYG